MQFSTSPRVRSPLLSAAALDRPCLSGRCLATTRYEDARRELLLLNIARVSTEETIQFTSTSSIAATFNWATTLGVSGEVTESKGNFLHLNIGGTMSEHPTFSISPISGKEFTERIATPFRDEIFEFLVFQGGGINQIMRLMASGILTLTSQPRQFAVSSALGVGD